MTGVPILQNAASGIRLALEIAWGADLTDLTAASWTWTDITTDVEVGEQGGGVSITIGRPDESTTTNTAALTCILDNTAGAYSQGGQSSNYPNVRRGTPVRLRVSTDSGSTWKIKFQGNAVGFTPNWDTTGKWAVVTLLASGPLRQINQGTVNVHSVLYNYLSSGVESITNYWPMEEDELATSFANITGTAGNGNYHYILNNQLLELDQPSTWSLHSSVGLPSSDALPTLPTLSNAGNATTACGGHALMPFPPSGTVQVSGVFDPQGATTSTCIWSMQANASTPYKTYIDRVGTQNAAMYLVYRADVSGAATAYSGNLLFGVDSASANLLAMGGGAQGNTAFNGIGTTPFRWRVTWNGTTSFTVGILKLGSTTEITMTGTSSSSVNPLTAYASSTVGTILNVTGTPYASGGGAGHLCYQTAATSLTGSADYVNAHLGETPAARITRLANANNTAVTVLTDTATETSASALDVMGYQYVDTLSNLLRETESTGLGVLYDGLNNGLTYTTRLLREGQQPVLTVDASANPTALIMPFAPVDDDQGSVNDFTTTRRNGASATYRDITGVLGVNAIGDYENSTTINPSTDTPLLPYAQWMVHQGTQPGYRYPTFTFELEKQSSLIASWLSCFPSCRVDVTNITAARTQHPTGTIRNVLEGWTETISQTRWVVQANCTNYDAWKVATLAAATGSTADTVGRYESNGSTVTSSVSAGATSLSVTTPSGPIWTQSSVTADDFPLDVSINGNRIHVTAISGASSPQTFTVSAVPYAIASGSVVTVWQNAVLGV